jgi:hypothetical protein
MRISNPPGFAQTDNLEIIKHPTELHQTLVGKVVQNHHGDQGFSYTVRKLLEKITLPPGNRFRQIARPRGKVQTCNRRFGEPAENSPAQNAVPRANFDEARFVGCRLICEGTAQGPFDPASVTHQRIEPAKIASGPQGSGIVSRELVEEFRTNHSACCHLISFRVR